MPEAQAAQAAPQGLQTDHKEKERMMVRPSGLRRVCGHVQLLTCCVAVVAALIVVTPSALAASPLPGWSISSVAEPANFSSDQTSTCETQPSATRGVSTGDPCDTYTVVARNVGSVATSGAITISDTLPEGVEAVGVSEDELQAGSPTRSLATCTLSPLHCTGAEPVPPGGVLIMTVNVVVKEAATGSVTNSATIGGGGALTVSTSSATAVPNTLNGTQPPFAINDFDFRLDGVDGTPDLQAGDHPYGLTASFAISTFLASPFGTSGINRAPVQQLKSLVVDLPMGLVGNPLAVPQCPLAALVKTEAGESNCPAASRVGIVTAELGGAFLLSGQGVSTGDLYNMVPEAGYPAEFGFAIVGVPTFLHGNVVRTRAGFGLRVSSSGVPALGTFLGLGSISLTFFGDPAEHDGGVTPSPAFLSNPTDCSAENLEATMEADSWEEPGRWVTAKSDVYPSITGCNMLQFQPTIRVAPEVTEADEPSGYEVDLKVPQSADFSPTLATPELKDATVRLPEGVSVSPSAADGLVGCKETGPEGIDMPQGNPSAREAGEGEELGADGFSHLVRGHCPAQSQIGTVEIVTPLLASPLEGRVYVAEPKCGGEGQSACTEADATDGNLFGLYLEAEGSGVVIKLQGKVTVDPVTGRLTGHFENNPQLPFSELKLQFKSGPRAPLANPQTCGEVTTTSILAPWSAPESGAAATPSSEFTVTGCGSPMPFSPGFLAQTQTPIAGGFSPLILTLSRRDREQDLSGISVTAPPGLLGMLSQVQLCPEPQASNGTCGSQSLIGHTEVGAGPGPHPFFEPGNVFLTGPYKAAPFGLSIVTHVQAGPFNLGNVIVRAAIHVDSHTTALTVTSDPLPRIIDGVPLRIQTVNVTVDKPGFIFNPTNCSQQSITGTIAGALPSGAPGASVPVSSPFAVAGCKSLPFKPKFTALTQAKTSKANGAYLHVKVASGPGQANIAKVKVDLPKQLPSRLTTLQKACTATVFEANPANCPAASVVGTGTAVTPVLKNPLTGPAFLVSHGGAAFPDLEIVLQGEGIVLYLNGNTDIKKGITSSTFNSVPDAPISTFDLVLPQGPHSALAANVPAKANGNLCSTKLVMPTTITGQNGAVLTQTTKIAVTSCPKAKKATLTRAQKLAKALKACKKKAKSKRAACERQARKKYAVKHKATSKKK